MSLIPLYLEKKIHIIMAMKDSKLYTSSGQQTILFSKCLTVLGVVFHDIGNKSFAFSLSVAHGVKLNKKVNGPGFQTRKIARSTRPASRLVNVQFVSATILSLCPELLLWLFPTNDYSVKCYGVSVKPRGSADSKKFPDSMTF